MDHEFYMQLALDAAWRYQGLTFPNPAVGACVVGAHGEVLGINAHQKAGEAHAEVLALRDAYVRLSGDKRIALTCNAKKIHEHLLKHHNNCFENCSIYVTLEPCTHHGKTPSCADLISALGIKNVIIGANDPNVEAAGGGARFSALHVKEDAAKILLEPFRLWQSKPFVMFKWAQRLDGTIDGGLVSSEASRRHVHALRNVCDLLVIGGNTVRTDRPTLDARMVKGRSPDVLIYSHRDDFERDIALFGVEGREVFIENSLDRIGSYRNVLIEGGAGMFEASKDMVDWYLAFMAPKSGGGTISLLQMQEQFETLHVSQIGSDVALWMQRK